MRPRGTLRFALALVVCFAAADLALRPAIEAGARVAAWWGVAAALVGLGFALALLFTVVYDGRRALAGQNRREARALR
jgi:hypothetical protein